MQAGLSADDGAEGAGRQALVDAHVLVSVQAADVKVPSHQGVARPRPGLDERVVEFPPVEEKQAVGTRGRG